MTETGAALADRYDLLLFDLDGVVYLGEHPVPQAAESLAALRNRQRRFCYVTNNASRSAEMVAGLLNRLRAPATPDDVLTSAQAGAQLLAERLPENTPVLVVGAPPLADEVSAVHLKPVFAAADEPAAVIQGYGPDVSWRHLAEATRAVGAGALWVATNTDRTVPSVHGPLPGNGALVAVVATAAAKQPDIVVGKPAPQLFVRAVRRYGAQRPLVVGDRLDTDIEGAVRAGYDSVFVLTGVGTAAEVLAADEATRPSYLAKDLTDLLCDYPDVAVDGGRGRCRDWTASVAGDRWTLTGDGDAVDALRALCGAAWSSNASLPAAGVVAESPEAVRALRELRLPTTDR